MSDLSILPPNATSAERALEAAIARATVDLSAIGQLMDPDTCPAHLLGWLAWAMSVDVWDPAWPETTKRTVIQASIGVHRRKGTRASVEEALSAIGSTAEIVEWWQDAAQPGAAPHTFEVWLDLATLLDVGADLPAHLVQLRRAIDATKPVRSHYTAHARVGADARAYTGAASRVSGRVANMPGIPEAPRVAAALTGGAVTRATGHLSTPVLEAA